jgi:hypothetical protein
MNRPKPGNGKEWLDTGGGVILALLAFFGIPARRRSWRSMLSAFVALAVLSVMAGCGGSSGTTTTTTTTATTPGNYTFTVKGTGNDPASTSQTATFTVTVN